MPFSRDMLPTPDQIPSIQKVLSYVVLGAALLTVIAWIEKGDFVDASDVLPALRWDPIQRDTTRSEFAFDYAGETYNVRPVADYELWGLVVSHNDPDGFGDIYHDETSVDTRDLCVIWGTNLQSNDFHRVQFDSGSWTCYYRYPGGVIFDPTALSNNHLITNTQSIRDQIEDVRVGDQIHISGSLANYQPAAHPRYWRESSTTRTDTGNGACEVVFVDEIEVLARGTPLWYAGYTFGWWLLILALLAKLGFFIWELATPDTIRRGGDLPMSHHHVPRNGPPAFAPQRRGVKRVEREPIEIE